MRILYGLNGNEKAELFERDYILWTRNRVLQTAYFKHKVARMSRIERSLWIVKHLVTFSIEL